MKKQIILASIAAGIFFGASCLKKQDLTQENLGDVVPAAAVAAALGEGFGAINYSDMKVGEVSSLVLSQKVQDGIAQTLEQQDVTLQTVIDGVSDLQLDVQATKIK